MSATQTQLRRGTSSQVAAMTPAQGEVVVNTTTKGLHVGDGLTAGGHPTAPLASPAFTGNPTAPTPTAGDSDTSIATTAFVQAAIAAIPTPSGMPPAVTGTLTTGGTAAFAVDFTTYSAYDVMIVGATASVGSQDMLIRVSSDGGTTFPTASRYSVGSSTNFEMPITNNPPSGLVGTLVQGDPGGDTFLGYNAGTPPTTGRVGSTRYATTGAVNYVHLALATGSFTAGHVVLQPKSKR